MHVVGEMNGYVFLLTMLQSTYSYIVVVCLVEEFGRITTPLVSRQKSTTLTLWFFALLLSNNNEMFKRTCLLFTGFTRNVITIVTLKSIPVIKLTITLSLQ